MIVYVVNDPERHHAVRDESEIGRETYLGVEDEGRAMFEARPMPAAIAHGLWVVCVSVEDFGPGLFLDDLRDEDDRREPSRSRGGLKR
jgi:hypothetical protein